MGQSDRFGPHRTPALPARVQPPPAAGSRPARRTSPANSRAPEGRPCLSRAPVGQAPSVPPGLLHVPQEPSWGRAGRNDAGVLSLSAPSSKAGSTVSTTSRCCSLRAAGPAVRPGQPGAPCPGTSLPRTHRLPKPGWELGPRGGGPGARGRGVEAHEQGEQASSFQASSWSAGSSRP